jgi:ribosomal protein S18 acetylase RimI-like enzyme
MPVEVATIHDANEILRLQRLAYQSEAARYDDYTLPPLTQSLEDKVLDFQKLTVLKITAGGKIIGSVQGYVRDGTGYIGRLMVQPEFQNQGIGTRLMGAIEASLSPVKRYELFTGHKSESTIRLYQKLGYHSVRTETVNDRLALVYMEKPAK